MRWMLNVCVKSGLVLEAHDAAECVAFSSGRNVGADMSLKQSGDLSLEGSDRFPRSTLLLFRSVRFPLKCKYVKDASCLFFSQSRLGPASSNECDGRGCEAGLAH